MKLFVAADHRGFTAKEAIITYLKKRGYDTTDSGDDRYDPTDDFPVFAAKATSSVLTNTDSRAILLCGSGQGMIMAANRIKGIRAGLGWSRAAARGVRNDEDANVLAIPAELYDTNPQEVYAIIDEFLTTPFANAPRFIRRNKELDSL